MLVVEDETCQQEWLMRNLSNTGQEIITACDGDWAFAYWKIYRPFDVVVMAKV